MGGIIAFIKALGQLALYAPALLKLWFEIKRAWDDHKLKEAEKKRAELIEALKLAKNPEEVRDAVSGLAKHP